MVKRFGAQLPDEIKREYNNKQFESSFKSFIVLIVHNVNVA